MALPVKLQELIGEDLVFVVVHNRILTSQETIPGAGRCKTVREDD
jgi:hypothetical protein